MLLTTARVCSNKSAAAGEAWQASAGAQPIACPACLQDSQPFTYDSTDLAGRCRSRFEAQPALADHLAAALPARLVARSFFDTAEEEQRTREMQQEFRPVTIEELEGKRRKDIEDALVKRDLKRQKIQESHNAPQALALAAELNDPMAPKRKGKMMLPAPQISEVELEQIARMSTDALLDEQATEGAGGEATRQLLGQYGPTPMRAPTPMTTSGRGAAPAGDRVLQAAQNLAKLNAMETPLMGGENPDLHPSDFSGVTPRNIVVSTPNPLLAAATPLLGGPGATPSLAATGRRPSSAIAGVPATPSTFGATPSRDPASSALASLPGPTPLRTPLRDQLGLNDADALTMQGGRRAQAAAAAALRSEIRAGLSSLPAPQNEYQIEMPALPEDGDAEEGAVEEDAADAKARKQREEEERLRQEELRKSKVGAWPPG